MSPARARPEKPPLIRHEDIEVQQFVGGAADVQLDRAPNSEGVPLLERLQRGVMLACRPADLGPVDRAAG